MVTKLRKGAKHNINSRSNSALKATASLTVNKEGTDVVIYFKKRERKNAVKQDSQQRN